MKIIFWEFVHKLIDRQLYRLLSRYQVTLKMGDKVEADVPLLSLIDYKTYGLFDVANTWHLSITKKVEPQK